MKSGAPECYVAMFESLKQVALRHGYALSPHGSIVRDFDLMAMPWIEDASDPKVFIEALCKEAGGFFAPHDVNPVLKPHGRLAYSFHLSGGPYVDVSVMPKIKESK